MIARSGAVDALVTQLLEQLRLCSSGMNRHQRQSGAKLVPDNVASGANGAGARWWMYC